MLRPQFIWQLPATWLDSFQTETKKMKIFLISWVLISTLFTVNAEAQFGGHDYPYLQGTFRNYPAAAFIPPPGVSQNARLFFGTTWVVSTTTTSTSFVTTTCTSSTAAIVACPSGRRRRGLLVDDEEEDADAIAPSAIQGYIIICIHLDIFTTYFTIMLLAVLELFRVSNCTNS